MNQILLGSAIPFVVIMLWYARRRGRASLLMLVSAPFWMGLGALWAVIPDLPRLFGAYGLYHRLAKDPRTDIFFWHYTIDRIETDSSLYHVGLIMMGLLLLAAAWRELSRRERGL
jgi:hypothetical protein